MKRDIDLKEWQKTDFDMYRQLREVRLPEDERTQRLVQELSGERVGKPHKLRIVQLREGLCLETTSFVGNLSLGDLDITIRPKIPMLSVLHLLQYVYELRQLDLFDAATLQVEQFGFQDLLIYQLERETRHLLARGLHRSYVRKQEMLTAPRGTISIQALARQGGIREQRLACTYYAHLEDSLLNQVLLAGVRLGIHLTKSVALRTRLKDLARCSLAEISSRRLTQALLKRVNREMSRLTVAYASPIKLIEMLMASQGGSLSGEQAELALPGFLFDMNQFFQELIGRFLEEYLPEYQVFSQYEITEMLGYIENPRGKQAPKLRPDYVIKEYGKIVAILDAKYRDLWEHDLPAHMLYQLVMYALSQADCHQAVILYPTIQADAREAKIEVRPSTQKPRYVTLRPVKMGSLEKLVVNRVRENNEQACRALAHELVFGSHTYQAAGG